MRTSNTRARKFSSTIGMIVMALVFASMIGGIFAGPAFGRDYYDRRGRYYQDGRYVNGRHVYYRHYYSEPVYAPPPVVYYPDRYQSPGINLFFPIRIR